MPSSIGRATFRLNHRPSIRSFAAVVGKKEGEGPLRDFFDHIFIDTKLGQDTWEKAESQLQKESLSRALEKGNLKEAASVMECEADMLADMFYTAMDGVRYLFDGSSFQADIDGRGMVFTKAGTVYYGTFKAGKPEGQCTALQVVDLDAPRYDYSQGIWKDGRMEGKGHTGYCYFERSPEGEARDICKTGTFSQDLMEGDVVYTSMNEEDQVSTWKLRVEHGIAIMDDRWDYVESTGEYQLLSEDNDNHAYVVEEDQAAMPMWVNLLIWEE